MHGTRKEARDYTYEVIISSDDKVCSAIAFLMPVRLRDGIHEAPQHSASQHKCHYAECHFAECRDLFIVMLSVVIYLLLC